MSQVMIDDELIEGIANSIRKMRKINYPITTDSFAGEIEQIDIGYDVNDTTWQRPLSWPDYSRIDLTGFEGMYFTYDTTVERGWIGLTATVSGGYVVERGQIVDGVFVVDTTTNVASNGNYYDWLPYTITGYVVYRLSAQNPVQAITKIGQISLTTSFTQDGTQDHYLDQPCLERYGRLPRVTNLSQWANVMVVSDTIKGLSTTLSFESRWYQCTSIENIDLTDFSAKVTSLYGAFRYCPQLKYLKVDGTLCTSSCTSLYATFQLCNNLYYIDTTNWDTSNVTSFYCTFNNCANLYNLDVSHFNTAKATNMYSMFSGCYKLRKLDVSNFNTSLVTSFTSMFNSCMRVEELDVSGFTTSNVTNMQSMFSACYLVKELDVSNFNTSKVTNMNSMFANCRTIESLDCHSFDTHLVTDMGYMFNACYKLKSLDIHGWDLSALTIIRTFIDSCYCLADFNMSGITTGSGMSVANCFASFSGSAYKIKKLDFSGWDLGNFPAVFTSVFRYDYQVEEIIMPTSFKQIGSTTFDNCRNLKKLVLPRTSVVVLDNVNAFGTTPATKVIYVPDNLISSYQTANVWKNLTGVTFAGLSELTN